MGVRAMRARTMAAVATLLLVIAACDGANDESSNDDEGASTETEQGDESDETATDPSPTELQISTYLGPNGPQMEALSWWADEVSSRTSGSITTEVIYSEGLLPATDTLPGVGENRAQVGYTNPGSYHPGELELSTVGEIPFVARNPEAVVRAYDAMYDQEEVFRQQFHDQGVEVLYFVPTGGAIIGATSEIRDLEDLQGKQIRAIGRLGNAIGEVGANPVAMSGAEIYEALERGVIDAFTSFPFEVVTDVGLEEVASDIIDAGFGNYGVGAVVINRDLYQGLSEEVRNTVDEVSDEATARTVELLSTAHSSVCDQLEDADVDVYEWEESATQELRSEVDVDELQSAWVEDVDSATDVEAAPFLSDYLGFVEEFRQEADYTPAVRACAS